MIFQIDYMSSGLYDDYFYRNSSLCSSLDYFVYRDDDIQKFLCKYGYTDIFYTKVVDGSCILRERPIRCALLRLMILYEIGGIYVDADTLFTENITKLEEDLISRYGDRNIVLDTRSLYFIKGVKGSKYIKYLLDLYINCDTMKTDVVMNSRQRILGFEKELVVVPKSYIDTYFYHQSLHAIR